ncbi:ubiquinol oxidase 2, mitochondrial-like isoform X2 [Actinidia eriantha]|uniref:ubiquinol oxidase 2, mitochondrial-like isoform X2 n=1 Tax=Actinidia eriantha TaxID=165200 RepID=UPI00258E3A06|nr:ubiquinol oxidase 2, mitochondrial-like isoform X2 [Actinidia eriantha]
MNQLVARAVLRGLASGRSCNRKVFTAAAVVQRPFDESAAMWRGEGGFIRGAQWRRAMSTAAEKESAVAEKDRKGSGVAEKKKEDGGKMVVSSYWGVWRPKITKEDGTEWPWNCFMRRYGCRAMMLETVAAVPGMVGGMLLHLRSLRKFQQSGGWIKALLEEAENERMHLMTMVELVQPVWYERLLVLTVQGVFFNGFFVLYLVSPKLAHRIVGYLEEEAIHSYTEYLKDIDNGQIENVPAPAISIDYWRLPKDATLKDVITVIRADEAHHRDVNHFASDIHSQGKQLREAPAPLGYH